MGADLLGRIADLVRFHFDFGTLQSGDHTIYNAMQLHAGPRRGELIPLYTGAARQLTKSAALALSIDNVIDALEDECVEFVGKLAISRAILQAEAVSPRFRREHRSAPIRPANFKDTWYDELTKILTEGLRKSNVETIFENLSVVNFNYDRCLEEYLPASIAEYYGIPLQVTQGIFDTLPTYRPYGTIGRLPWQSGSAEAIPFGAESPAEVLAGSNNLRTFTERVTEGDLLEAIKIEVGRADRIVFLGFAFHRQNVELLAQSIQDHTEVLGTVLGVSNSDQGVIEAELLQAFEPIEAVPIGRITLEDMTCAKFFTEYRRTLTALPPEG